MTRVILIRHGQSTFNALGLYQGSSDAAVLTEKGVQTAYQTGKFLQQESIAAVYSSPLQRTQQTAQTVVKSLASALPILTHDQLREIDLPNWQGLSYSHVREQDTIAYRCWRDRPHEFQIESAQETAAGNLLTKVETATYPVLDLYRRAQEFWQAVLPMHPTDTIAIVSHGGTIRALISTALGIAPSAFHQMQQSNCGISILDFSATRPAQLVALNLTHQLGESLPKLKEGKRGLRLLLLPMDPSCTTNAESWVETCAQVPINFCLSQDSSTTQPLKEQLDRLQSRSVVHLQVDTQNFLPVWNQMITRNVCPLDTVCTGLVVATTSEIQGLLHRIVGAVRPNSLRVEPGKLAVVYYPTSTTHPILQAMNWAIAG
jgi:probable phosphoglycerate mutase